MRRNSYEPLGFRFSSKNENIRMKLTNKTKKKFKAKMKYMNNKIKNNEITISKYTEVRNSYRGHLSYGNCKKLYYKYTLIN